MAGIPHTASKTSYSQIECDGPRSFSCSQRVAIGVKPCASQLSLSLSQVIPNRLVFVLLTIALGITGRVVARPPLNGVDELFSSRRITEKIRMSLEPCPCSHEAPPSNINLENDTNLHLVIPFFSWQNRIRSRARSIEQPHILHFAVSLMSGFGLWPMMPILVRNASFCRRLARTQPLIPD